MELLLCQLPSLSSACHVDVRPVAVFASREWRASPHIMPTPMSAPKQRAMRSVQVEPGATAEEFIVKGRGMLHLGILVENMRREGFEFQARCSCCSCFCRNELAAHRWFVALRGSNMPLFQRKVATVYDLLGCHACGTSKCQQVATKQAAALSQQSGFHAACAAKGHLRVGKRACLRHERWLKCGWWLCRSGRPRSSTRRTQTASGKSPLTKPPLMCRTSTQAQFLTCSANARATCSICRQTTCDACSESSGVVGRMHCDLYNAPAAFR